MSIVLGFGQYHFDITQAWAYALAEEIVAKAFSKETTKEIVEAHIREAGKTQLPSGDIEHASFRELEYSSNYDGHASIVVEGQWTHVRKDHPYSPDGIAAMYIQFCITVFRSDIWKPRIYVTVS